MKLASVFSSHMVLQQAQPVSVWGTASPGVSVKVSFAGQDVRGVADADGRWSVSLPPMSTSSEPRTLIATSPEGSVTLSDVLVGEVWLCSGQSNMQMTVDQSRDAAAEVTAARYPHIRLLGVPQRAADEPDAEFPGVAWTACTPESVKGFSAVGYCFGRELHRRLRVPVGLINASWGGTVAEAWTSRASLLGEPLLRPMVDASERDLPENFQARHQEWVALMADHDARTADTENSGFGQGWAALPDPAGEWADMVLPGFWQSRGLKFSGIFWFRKVVDVPAAWAGKDLELAIGATDKSDVTYFNNEQVGSITMQQTPEAWAMMRTYTVPGRLVREGRNVIAVRVHSNKFAGGMTGPAHAMRLACPSAPDFPPLALDGAWRYAVEKSYGLVELPKEPVSPNAANRPSVLFNGMINFLVPFAMRGAIWYQGESNAARALQYRTLFPTLIRDWRKVWGREDFAFHFVQLANYTARNPEPGESQWAALREAQTMALALPQTGMAVIIDIGDADDIHPANKQDVGFRLALNALHRTYGKRDVIPHGPLYRAAQREGRTMRVAFDGVGGGLACRGASLRGFAIAGADRKFVWADACIEGESVVAASPAVAEPVAVRYGWADNPDCNLYNYAGLPASPFRTDDW
ncbi:MAG: 9-O-acetylesterase [Lentisphaerae bacterium]|nr:9-O-acetylesterase [Lentisphaerota bacterium]